jgi:ornithine cyclodeaminase
MNSRPTALVFQENAIRRAISLGSGAIDVIENGFRHPGSAEVCIPPMMQIFTGDTSGQTCVKGAWMTGVEYFAVKLSSIYPRQPGADYAEPNGMFVLVETATGRVNACLMDNGY